MSDRLLTLTAPVELQAAAGDGKQKKLAIVAYTGGPMTVDMFGPVVIDMAGMTLPPSLPILADHDSTLAGIVGTGTPKITAGTLTVNGPVAPGPAGDRVIELLTAGVSLQASVGATPDQKRYLRPTEKATVNGKEVVAGPNGLLVVEKSTLKEISVTPLGADANSAVSLAARKGTAMPDILDRDAIVREERERIGTIEKITAGLHLTGAFASQIDTLKAKAIDGEITVDALRAGCLDAIRASRSTGADFVHRGNGTGVFTAKHLGAALMIKAGFSTAAEKSYGAQILEQSRRLHRQSLPDLCRAALEIDGRDCPESRDGMIKAALSTGSMPIALGDSANKVLQIEYMQAPASWRQVAAVKSAANFKDQTAIRPTFAGNLAQLPPGGELKHGAWEEETYVWNIDTFGKIYGFDRRDIINDDLGAIAEVVPGLAKAAARAVSDLAYTTLLSGASTFFTSGHANYFEGAATNLQASSLASAIKLLRQMKDADGNLLDLAPAVLLVPPELEFTAKALINSSEVQRYVASGTDSVPMGNPFLDLCQVAVEPRLSDTTYTGYSLTAWYLFSAPANAAMVIGFLDGNETPTIETFGFDAEVDKLQMSYRCVYDFGAANGDYRAAIKSKGRGLIFKRAVWNGRFRLPRLSG